MPSYEYCAISFAKHKNGYDGIVIAQRYTPEGRVTFMEGERFYNRLEKAVKNMENALALRGWVRQSGIFSKPLPPGEVETHNYRLISAQMNLAKVGMFKKQIHGSFHLSELGPDGWQLLKTTSKYNFEENTRYPEKEEMKAELVNNGWAHISNDGGELYVKPAKARFVSENSSTPAPSTAPQANAIEQLRQIGELHKAGILTDAEFQEKKAKLLRCI